MTAASASPYAAIARACNRYARYDSYRLDLFE
jgi:mevalonate pyrophosphate decarboxylase